MLDHFVGSGNAGVAARAMDRRFLGVDVSAKCLAWAEDMLQTVKGSGFEAAARQVESGEEPPQDLPMTGVV